LHRRLHDNGSPFKGRLLSAFCEQLDIRLIHAAVNHPQTNGKLERAFRDDMRDFYKQYDAWRFDRLRSDLPGYVHYRNYLRGHHALGGKAAAISRLKEHAPDVTLCSLLDRLESYARYEIGRKIIPATGRIRLLGRDAYVGKIAATAEATFCESPERTGSVDKRSMCSGAQRLPHLKQMKMQYRLRELPRALYFETYKPVICPRIAVAP
jgi:hypothetical protein